VIAVSYYTRTGSYPEEAELLKQSMEHVGMEFYVMEVEDRGDWYANTRYKPRFIQSMLKSLRGPLLYIDVDAFVHEDCGTYFDELAERGVDFGAHWYRGPGKGNDQTKVREEGWRMLSGTMFFGDTDGARRLIDTWCLMNDILFQQGGIAKGGGQKNLWFLTTCMTDIVIERLPGRYCYAFDRTWAYPGDEPCVIEQTIASRDHREKAHRRTTARDRRILQLKKSIETGVAAPHPRTLVRAKVEMSRLEAAEERRKAAGRSLSDAKHEYKDALVEEMMARKEQEE